MENSSNNNRFIKTNSLLWLLVFIFLNSTAFGQNYFNKLYTLDASAAALYALAPHGSDGGFVAVGDAVDSSVGYQGVCFSRFDKKGMLLRRSFFQLPDYPTRRVGLNYKCIAKVHDNYYAVVGTLIVPSAQTAFMLSLDSNGNVLHYKELYHTKSGVDTFLYTSDIRYDGMGHLLVAGHCLSTGDTTNPLLLKFDTSAGLPELWRKEYRPKKILRAFGIFNLIVTPSGYILCGGASFPDYAFYDNYRYQSVMLQVDTPGIEQWVYASPTKYLTDCQSEITHAIHTLDGGYLLSFKGKTYNRFPSTAPVIDLAAKAIIVKLDAARNKLWELDADSFYTGFGLKYNKFIEQSDSSFMFFGVVSTDSIDEYTIHSKLLIRRYNKTGVLLYQKELRFPTKDIGDTSVYSYGSLHDIVQTADKGFVFCGQYKNASLSTPLQKAWLIKLDSNGCLGADDPQCDPLSISKQPPVALEGFKVYPNPAQHSIHISIAANELKVYNTLGQIVLQASNISAQQPITISNIKSGLYYIAVYDKEKNKVGVAKFYKE